MNRDELVEVTKQAIADWWQTPEGQAASVGEALAVVAAIEPLIRADQLAKDHNDYDGDPSAGWHLEYQQEVIKGLEARLKDTQRQAKELTDQRVKLRAQVEARRMEAWDEFRSIDSPGGHVRKRALSERAKAMQDVLDLMDGVVDD